MIDAHVYVYTQAHVLSLTWTIVKNDKLCELKAIKLFNFFDLGNPLLQWNDQRSLYLDIETTFFLIVKD